MFCKNKCSQKFLKFHRNKRDSNTGVFLLSLQNFKHNYLEKHLRTTASSFSWMNRCNFSKYFAMNSLHHTIYVKTFFKHILFHSWIFQNTKCMRYYPGWVVLIDIKHISILCLYNLFFICFYKNFVLISNHNILIPFRY